MNEQLAFEMVEFFSWHERLTTTEIDGAYAEGLKRFDNARRKDRAGRYGNANGLEERHADGLAAVAEKLISHTTGRRWVSRGFKPDRGEDVEGISVRHSKYWSGRALIHPDDRNDLITVLVVGPDRYRLSVRGWIWTARGKNLDWWDTTMPQDSCYAVPQSALSMAPPPPLDFSQTR